jgi:hypothetical protein
MIALQPWALMPIYLDHNSLSTELFHALVYPELYGVDERKDQRYGSVWSSPEYTQCQYCKLTDGIRTRILLPV